MTYLIKDTQRGVDPALLESALVTRAQAFYLDWETACNLCEDEFGGSTFDWYVRDFMLTHGWTEDDVARRKDYFTVRDLAEALKEKGQDVSIWTNKKRYAITRTPVRNTKTGVLLGHVVRMSDGTSHFEASKRVPAGHCVNFGL